MISVLPGKIYKHRNGGKYLVLCITEESTNIRVGQTGVVYVSLTYGKIKYRDLSEFIEKVEWPDGIKRRRFILEDKTKDMKLNYRKKVPNPMKQKVFWAVNQGFKAGVFIDSFDGLYIKWSNIKKEIEEKVISQCPKVIPVNSKVKLVEFQGKKDWCIVIINKKGKKIGDVWIGGNPYKNWSLDGLIRVGKVINDTKCKVWQVLQRYSDGSYRIVKSYV